MSYSIREMRKEEYSLLSDFLYEAIYIPDGTAAPPKSVITCPELQVYIADFGNSKHDKALIGRKYCRSNMGKDYERLRTY